MINQVHKDSQVLPTNSVGASVPLSRLPPSSSFPRYSQLALHPPHHLCSIWILTTCPSNPTLKVSSSRKPPLSPVEPRSLSYNYHAPSKYHSALKRASTRRAAQILLELYSARFVSKNEHCKQNPQSRLNKYLLSEWKNKSIIVFLDSP